MLLMEMHTLHVSNITALLSKSSNKDTLGLKKKTYKTSKIRSAQKPLTQQWYVQFGFTLQ